jgi:hypothetical protein
MRLLFALLLFLNSARAFELFSQWLENGDQLDQNDKLVHFEGEKHLRNVKQLTFGGANAEAYFSIDNTKLTFQASGGPYGTDCDQVNKQFKSTIWCFRSMKWT